MRTTKTTYQKKLRPGNLSENELLEHRDRLEGLLQKGELSPKEGRTLDKVRAALESLEILKYGV